MTTIADIRDIETRLHSHFLEWSDTPLQNEQLYLLDDLQELHGQLAGWMCRRLVRMVSN